MGKKRVKTTARGRETASRGRRAVLANRQRTDKERLADERYFGAEWSPVLWLMRQWPEEVKESIRGIADPEDLVKKFVSDFLEKLVPKTEEMRGWRRQYIREMRRTRLDGRAQHERHYEAAFDLLEMFIYNTAEYLDTTMARLDESGLAQALLPTVMLRLGWRAVLIAQEVLWLLKGGFPEGAMARWRTLHEVAVVASFVRLHGNDAAERFLAHEVLKSIDWPEDERDGLEPEAVDEEPDGAWAQRKREEYLAKYGPYFAGHYGWATGVVKGKPTFAQIEEKARMSAWRPAYAQATYPVHATSRPLHNEIFIRHGKDVAGPTSNGVATPAIMTIRSLLQVNCAAMVLFVNSIEEAGADMRTAVMLDAFAREAMDEFAAHEWQHWELDHPED